MTSAYSSSCATQPQVQQELGGGLPHRAKTAGGAQHRAAAREVLRFWAGSRQVGQARTELDDKWSSSPAVTGCPSPSSSLSLEEEEDELLLLETAAGRVLAAAAVAAAGPASSTSPTAAGALLLAGSSVVAPAEGGTGR